MKTKPNKWTKEFRANYMSKYRKNNLDKHRSGNFRLLTGININQGNLDFLYKSQNGRCAICDKHQNELKRRLFIDYCHEKKMVRGLLCQKCNSGLGMFYDNISFLEKAILYLKKQ